MTDSDIIKAMEYCTMGGDCLACPACEENTNCMITFSSAVKRQQAEIERLTAEKDNLIRNYKECAMEVVKDFAGRLKEKAYPSRDWWRGMVVAVESIDALVAEMEGENA